MSNSFAIPPEALFLPPNVTVRKSRQKSSRSITDQGRLVIEESDSEDEVGGASPILSEMDWLCRQEGLSPIKRKSDQSEVAT
jgi:hypothetical protein